MNKIYKLKLTWKLGLILLLILSLSLPVSSKAEDGFENDIVVFYDSTDQLTMQVAENLKIATVDYKNLIKFVEVHDKSDMDTYYQISSMSKIFIFHGNENGFFIENQLINWFEFSLLANFDSSKYYSFLGCSSNRLKPYISQDLLGYDSLVDYKITIFDALMYISDFYQYSESMNHDISKEIFNSGLNYLDSLGMEFYDRSINPIDPLYTFSESESAQYYLALTIESIINALQNMESQMDDLGFGSRVDDAYSSIMGTTWSTLISASLIGLGAPATSAIGLIENLVLDFVNDWKVDAHQGSITQNIQLAFQSANFINVFAQQFGISIYNSLMSETAGLVKLWNSVYSFYGLSEAMEIIDVGCSAWCNGYDAIEADLGFLIDDLEDFVTALQSDFAEVKATTQSVINSLDTVMSTAFGGMSPLHPDLREWYEPILGWLETGMDEFITSGYTYIDTNPDDYAYFEHDFSSDCSGIICWGSNNIDIDYWFENKGGNQVAVKAVSYWFKESTDDNEDTKNHDYRYWVAPGEKKQHSFSLSKNKWSGSYSMLHSFTITNYNNQVDVLGDYVNSLRDKDSYFPQQSHAQIQYDLNGESITSARVLINKINDAYSRYFRVFLDGSLYYSVVISNDIEFSFTSFPACTTIAFEIYYGGYAYNGWRLDYTVLNYKLMD